MSTTASSWSISTYCEVVQWRHRLATAESLTAIFSQLRRAGNSPAFDWLRTFKRLALPPCSAVLPCPHGHQKNMPPISGAREFETMGSISETHAHQPLNENRRIAAKPGGRLDFFWRRSTCLSEHSLSIPGAPSLAGTVACATLYKRLANTTACRSTGTRSPTTTDGWQ